MLFVDNLSEGGVSLGSLPLNINEVNHEKYKGRNNIG